MEPLPTSAIIVRILLIAWVLLLIAFCFGYTDAIIPLMIGFCAMLAAGIISDAID